MGVQKAAVIIPAPCNPGQLLMKFRFMNLKTSSDELIRLDALRFVASVGIVIYHASSMWNPLSPALEASISGFRIFVDLFFVISGIVIMMVYGHAMKTPRDYTKFVIRRIARLAPLHWVTLFSFVLIGTGSIIFNIDTIQSSRYDTQCILPQIILVHSFDTCDYRTFNIVSWSISAEMFLYIIFPVFLLLINLFGRFTIVFAFFLACFIYFLDPYFTHRTFDGGAFRAVPSFLFGMGLYSIRELLKKIPALDIMYYLSPILFVACALARLPDIFLLVISWAWVAVTFSADVVSRPDRFTRKFAPLGQLTYSLYMLHPLVQTVFITVIGSKLLGLDNEFLDLWLVLIMVIVLPIFSMLSLYYFETPARRLITRIGDRFLLKS